MNDFYDNAAIVLASNRYQGLYSGNGQLRVMFCSAQIFHIDIGVTLCYWVYPDPTHYGLTVEVNSENSGTSRRVYSREVITEVIRTECPWAEWTDRPANWLSRLN